LCAQISGLDGLIRHQFGHFGFVAVVDHDQVVDGARLRGDRFQRLGEQIAALVRDHYGHDLGARSVLDLRQHRGGRVVLPRGIRSRTPGAAGAAPTDDGRGVRVIALVLRFRYRLAGVLVGCRCGRYLVVLVFRPRRRLAAAVSAGRYRVTLCFRPGGAGLVRAVFGHRRGLYGVTRRFRLRAGLAHAVLIGHERGPCVVTLRFRLRA
jgi:hypothetical protein